MNPTYEHFKGKDAVSHVAEAQARGIIAGSEIHGTEIPGSISAGSDAARETVILLSLLGLFNLFGSFSNHQSLIVLALFTCGWALWKTGRAAWLGWSRLERLHRILEEERWEIEHNRAQEREELKALYAAKGFQGKLLEDVLDVLMADGDRLLKVMIEEELGLTLEVHEHPLKQALGALVGVVLSSAMALLLFAFWPPYGLYAASLLVLGISAGLSAYYEGNRLIPAIVWNIGLGGLAFGSTLFLIDYFLKG